jgi:murein tripeptide amidase MpaA
MFVLDFEAMETWLKNITINNEKIAKLDVIGHSHEGRPLYVVQIEHPHTKNKPIVFIEAGAHAREWIAPAVALKLIDRLIHASNPKGENL